MSEPEEENELQRLRRQNEKLQNDIASFKRGLDEIIKAGEQAAARVQYDILSRAYERKRNGGIEPADDLNVMLRRLRRGLDENRHRGPEAIRELAATMRERLKKAVHDYLKREPFAGNEQIVRHLFDRQVQMEIFRKNKDDKVRPYYSKSTFADYVAGAAAEWRKAHRKPR